MSGAFNLREDVAGQSPPDVSGEREQTAIFDKAAADHGVTLKKLEMGALGRIIGGSDSAPNHIAFVAMGMGFLLAGLCLVQSRGLAETDARFWQTYSERALAFSASCLSYIFGKSASKS